MKFHERKRYDRPGITAYTLVVGARTVQAAGLVGKELECLPQNGILIIREKKAGSSDTQSR